MVYPQIIYRRNKKMRQSELEFRRGAGRGAPGRPRRKGAGRPPKGTRSSERHEVRPRIESKHPLHVVIRAVRGVRLRRRAGWRAVRHALGLALRRPDFRVCHLSIQSTHVHLIIEADDRVALARGMQGFQIACARRFNALRGRRGTLFSDRYHPVALESPGQVRNALGYVLTNWRRHGEDIGSSRRLDPYSSAAVFADWNPRPQSETAPGRERLPVVMPSTWLLAVGWRRRGAISPFARPPTRRR